MTLTLMSPAFADGAPIPPKHSRNGENLFPPLKWSGAPEETKSFALMVEDPDAPSGRRLLQPLRRAGGSGQQDDDYSPDGRTVHRGMCQQRRHPGLDLRLAELREQSGAAVDVARLGVVRHRRAEHEVRLHGRVPRRQRELLQQQHPPHLPREQRRAEPVHDGPQPVQHAGADAVRSVLRAGPVDRRPADAAGRAPLRARVELLPGTAGRSGEVSADSRRLSRADRRRRLRRHHARAWARPTTCSGTGRRRSR